MTANLIVFALVLLAGAVLAQPRLLRARAWRATVTPLASIIGSGFLVLAPLLVREFGRLAVLVMAGLCAVAYLVGERFDGTSCSGRAHRMQAARPSGWSARPVGRWCSPT